MQIDEKDIVNIEWKILDFKKKCTICKKKFSTPRKNKNICSFKCKMEHNRRHSRFYARWKRNRKDKEYSPCEICGFSATTDRHEENGKIVTLCPNHHCLITRNIKTLEELFAEKIHTSP